MFRIIPNELDIVFKPVHHRFYTFLINKGVDEKLSKHIIEKLDLDRLSSKDPMMNINKASDVVMAGILWQGQEQGAEYWQDLYNYLIKTNDVMWELVGVEYD